MFGLHLSREFECNIWMLYMCSAIRDTGFRWCGPITLLAPHYVIMRYKVFFFNKVQQMSFVNKGSIKGTFRIRVTCTFGAS